MKNTFLFSALIVLVSCVGPSAEEMRTKLPGYWEIEKVVLTDGSERTFDVNTVIDFIELDESTGLRKKVTPQLDGSFLTNKAAEQFTAVIENDSLKLHYDTPYDQWTETVVIARDSTLVIANTDGKVYWYKRYRPIFLSTE